MGPEEQLGLSFLTMTPPTLTYRGKFRCWNRCPTNPSDHQGSLVMRSLAQICFLHLKRLHPKRRNPNLLLNPHQRGMLVSLIKSHQILCPWKIYRKHKCFRLVFTTVDLLFYGAFALILTEPSLGSVLFVNAFHR